jgi:hypothetical protein
MVIRYPNHSVDRELRLNVSCVSAVQTVSIPFPVYVRSLSLRLSVASEVFCQL